MEAELRTHRIFFLISIAILVSIALAAVQAQRLPVLQQIDLPHPYYYREMYLPQLTSGPSSVAWIPSQAQGMPPMRPGVTHARSQAALFSMQGSLWRQRLDSAIAEQLTDGPGYDYQPDVSPDGKWAVYATYDNDAGELWLLDLPSGATRALTANRAGTVEPRLA